LAPSPEKVATFQAARFSVWAERNLHVVWSDAALKYNDKWMVEYANSTLETLDDFLRRNSWPKEIRARILLETKNRIAQEIQRWKWVARRCRALQEQYWRQTTAPVKVAETAALSGTQQPPAATPLSQLETEAGLVRMTITPDSKTSATTAQDERAASRKAFIVPKLKAKGLSTEDWAKKATPPVDFNTANDYMRGITNPHRDTLKRLADAIGVQVDQMPE
jgi:hypothetical protein